MSKKIVLGVTELLLDTLRGIAIISLVSPFVLYQFIHGDSERYVWLISGPDPFSKFGGGPYQLIMYVSLIIVGLILLLVAFMIKKKIKSL